MVLKACCLFFSAWQRNDCELLTKKQLQQKILPHLHKLLQPEQRLMHCRSKEPSTYPLSLKQGHMVGYQGPTNWHIDVRNWIGAWGKRHDFCLNFPRTFVLNFENLSEKERTFGPFLVNFRPHLEPRYIGIIGGPVGPHSEYKMPSIYPGRWAPSNWRSLEIWWSYITFMSRHIVSPHSTHTKKNIEGFSRA